MNTNCEGAMFKVKVANAIVGLFARYGGIVFLLCFSMTEAYAQFSYVQNGDDITIGFQSRTNVVQTALTCPRNGFVVAAASGSIEFRTSAARGNEVARIYLVRTSRTRDNTLKQIAMHSGDVAGNHMVYPFSYHKVFDCTNGESVRVYLTAEKWANTPTTAKILNPVLTLQFLTP